MSNTQYPKLDVDVMLDTAALPERTVDVCLRGDLYAQWETLNRELEDLVSGAESMGDPEGAPVLREWIADAEGQMGAATLTLRLRALPKREADRIIVDNPAREGNKVDASVGFNMEAVEVATIRACCVEPELNDARWAKFAAVLTASQWRTIMSACDALNYTALDLPFLSAGSGRLPA